MASINEYITLIESFVLGRTDAVGFEKKYMEFFKEDCDRKPETIFLILDELFADVDEFCSQPELRGEGDIDENELRSRCNLALGKLKGLD